MDNLNDLKAIWLSAKTDHLPTSEEVVSMAKKFRNKTLRRKIVMITVACFNSLLMLAVMVFYKSTLLSTWIGEILIIVSCSLLASTNIRSIGRFYNLRDTTNDEFLEFLEKTKQNQIRYYRKTEVIRQGLGSIGLLVYLYEFVHRDLMVMTIAYSVIVAYLAILWFIVRPRRFKKNLDQLSEKQNRVEKLIDQLNEE